MKDTFYFPHDYEAVSDPKISALIAEHGAAGYGIYWRIIEMLHADEAHQLPKKPFMYAAIAKQLSTNVEQVLACVNTATTVCELFVEDKDFIRSLRVDRNMQRREEISQKRTAAAQASASKRQANAQQVLANAQHLSTKERRSNKRRRDKNTSESDTAVIFTPPVLSEVKAFFTDNQFPAALGERAFEYYNESNWKDSNGNPVRNWKQKMRGVWFKDDQKVQPAPVKKMVM